MAAFNYGKKEIDAKIVYCGPTISGKTTNLRFIHQHLKSDQRGRMVSLATNEDRTLFFDFLFIELEKVRGFNTRFHIYTAPGQVCYGETRKAVLKGTDGVVFVADSQGDRIEDNLASLKDLEENLRSYGRKIETTPLVIQYNKRDLPGVLSVEELNQKFNRLGSPYFESVAISGKGVFESLTMACRLVLKALEKGVESRRPVSAPKKPVPSPPIKEDMQLEKSSTLPVPPPSRLEGGMLPSPEKGSQVNKALAPPKLTDPSMEGTPGNADPKWKKEVPVRSSRHPAQISLDSPRPQVSREQKIGAKPIGDRVGLGKGVSPGDGPVSGEQASPASKRIPSIKENVQILSCGEPRISSPSLLEIALNLAVATEESSFSLSLRLSINLEQISPGS